MRDVHIAIVGVLAVGGGALYVSRRLRERRRWHLVHTNAAEAGQHALMVEEQLAAMNAAQGDVDAALRKGFNAMEASAFLDHARGIIRAHPALLGSAVANGLSFAAAALLARARARLSALADGPATAGADAVAAQSAPIAVDAVAAVGRLLPRGLLVGTVAVCLPTAALLAALPLRLFLGWLAPAPPMPDRVKRMRVTAVLLHALGYFWCLAAPSVPGVAVAAAHSLVPAAVLPRLLRGTGLQPAPAKQLMQGENVVRMDARDKSGVYALYKLGT